MALPWPPLRRSDPAVALRPWGANPADADVLAQAWVDPEVARWTAVPEDASVEAAARWIAGEGARRDAGIALDLAIADPIDPTIVLGEVGLVVVEPERQWAEIGYWVLADRRGQGVASAALGLFTKWVLAEQPVKRLFARTRSANPAAGAVARAAGYDNAGELEEGLNVWVRDLDRPTQSPRPF